MSDEQEIRSMSSSETGWPRRPERFAADIFPVWGLDDPDGFFYYGFPLQPGRVGLKAARHFRGEPVELDAIDRMPHPRDEQEIRSALARYLFFNLQAGVAVSRIRTALRGEPTAGTSAPFAFNIENLHVFDPESEAAIC